jgi:hypothetical protein
MSNSEKEMKFFKDGLTEGIEIARQMLCKVLKKDFDSFGEAAAHVDLLIIEKEKNEINTRPNI